MFGLQTITFTIVATLATIISAAPSISKAESQVLTGFCTPQSSTGGYCMASDGKGGNMEWIFCGVVKPCTKNGNSCSVVGSGTYWEAYCT